MILNHYLSGFIIFYTTTLTVMSGHAAEAELSMPVKEGSDDLRGVKPSAKKRHTALANKQQLQALRGILALASNFMVLRAC